MIYFEDLIWAVKFDHSISDNQRTDSIKAIEFQIHSELCRLAQANHYQVCKHWKNSRIVNAEQFFSSRSQRKSRIIHLQSNQRIDYDKIFASMIRVKIIKMLLALMIKYDYEVEQMNVITAFLEAHLKKEIWMQ